MSRVFKKAILGMILLCALLGANCSHSRHAVGYIEGEYTYIASGVAGTLVKLAVKRGQSVKKDDLLYQLDPEPERSLLENSQENIEDLKAQVALAKVTLERQRKLYLKTFATKADLDQAQASYSSKVAQLAASQALYGQANWSLQQKTMYAPVTGKIFDTFYRLGEKIPVNQPVLAILAPENIKVLFYIPEEQLSEMKIGQTIYFGCDHCKERTAATVSYISPEAEYTPPVIYSKDTRDKLVYLIRADLPAAIAGQFHPGQPIDVYWQS